MLQFANLHLKCFNWTVDKVSNGANVGSAVQVTVCSCLHWDGYEAQRIVVNYLLTANALSKGNIWSWSPQMSKTSCH